MNKKISIIIPVFNHEKELASCLKALQLQTRKPEEVIIVDDGSNKPLTLPRETGGLVLKLIRLKKNTGAPKARNTGFQASSGEYIMFLDADATLRPDALEKLSRELEITDIDFVYSAFHWGKKYFPSRDFDVESLKKENYIHTSALLRRESFSAFDESLKKFQDWDLFLTMAERGKRGVRISESLFTVKPRRKGMSYWLPSFLYDIPWHRLPFQPRVIRRYKEARRIIQKKHNLPSFENQIAENILIALLLIVIFEAISLAVVFFPVANSLFAMLFATLLFIVTWKMPTAGFAVLVTELMIGSKGALFKLLADSENNRGLSIRILFFMAFMFAWLLRISWKEIKSELKYFFSKRWEYVILGGLLLWAFLYGIMRKNPFVLQDANAWGFLLLLIPALNLTRRYGKKMREHVLAGIFAGMSYVAIKTLVLLYLFSHPIGTGLEVIYYWVRKTGVGEITRILEGASVYRIFFQSHIFEVLALTPVLFILFFTKEKKRWWSLFFILSFSTVLISFSRSFFLGIFAGAFLAITFLFLQKAQKPSLFFMIKTTGILASLSILLVLGALFFPIPPASHIGLSTALQTRLNAGESALKSRWQLLPILWDGIKEAPILGHGFGSTITYRSSDPRIIQATGGEYKTYSFEWGWLDFWYKFGILGIPVILLILFRISFDFWKLSLPSWQKILPGIMLVTLVVIHAFTPYLNHPLGFLVLILLQSALMLESTKHLKKD